MLTYKVAAALDDNALSDFTPLWSAAFGDDGDTVRELCRSDDANLIALLYDGDTAAAGCLIMPCELIKRNKNSTAASKLSGHYYYAMTVRENLRGRGLFRCLCERTLGYSCAHGASFAMLIPSRTEYYAMYNSLGFIHAASGFTLLCAESPSAALPDGVSLEMCGANELYCMRTKSNAPRFTLPPALLEKALRESDGAAYRLVRGGDICGYIVAGQVRQTNISVRSIKIYDYCIYNGAENYIIEVTPATKALYAAFGGAALCDTEPAADIFFEG